MSHIPKITSLQWDGWQLRPSDPEIEIPDGWLEYKAVYTTNYGGICTYGSYAQDADMFVRELLERDGHLIKHIDEIEERHEAGGYMKIRINIRKYNLWLAKFRKSHLTPVAGDAAGSVQAEQLEE